MITSSPGNQFTGVATWCFAVSCSESITRSTSSKFPARCHWIDKYQLDLLIWSDDVNITHSRVIGGFARFGVSLSIGRQHPVEFRDFEVRIADDWIVRRMTLSLFDVLRPSLMIAGRIDRQSP